MLRLTSFKRTKNSINASLHLGGTRSERRKHRRGSAKRKRRRSDRRKKERDYKRKGSERKNYQNSTSKKKKPSTESKSYSRLSSSWLKRSLKAKISSYLSSSSTTKDRSFHNYNEIFPHNRKGCMNSKHLLTKLNRICHFSLSFRT